MVDEKAEKLRKERKKGTEKGELLYSVCVTKRTRAGSEAVVCKGTRLLDPELQKPHLTFLLMREDEHMELRH